MRWLAVVLVVGTMYVQPAPVFAADGFDAQFEGESAFLTLRPGSTGSFTVFFRNTGTSTWVRGSATQVDLAACLEDKVTCDRISPRVSGWNAGWLTATRYATHAQTSVEPGAIATFTYQVVVPTTAPPGLYRFNGDLVLSSAGRMIHPQGYYQDVTVLPTPSPTPTPRPTPVASPTPTPTPEPGSGPTPAPASTPAYGY